MIINDYFERQIDTLLYYTYRFRFCKRTLCESEERTYLLSADESRARREIVSLFSDSNECNVQTTSVETMTIMALLSRDPFGIEIPENAPILLSYESHNGARLSKVDPPLDADIQSARRKYSTNSVFSDRSIRPP